MFTRKKKQTHLPRLKTEQNNAVVCKSSYLSLNQPPPIPETELATKNENKNAIKFRTVKNAKKTKDLIRIRTECGTSTNH